MVTDYSYIKELEKQLYDDLTPEVLKEINEETRQEIDNFLPSKSHFEQTINCLPIINEGSPLDGVLRPEFWRYYKPPFHKTFFYEFNDPYNDLISIIYGPRGGGKTISAVAINIVDGQMRGIPVVSNVPFAWAAKDANNKLYKVESEPFDVEKFAKGDRSLKYKRLLIDEGNYLADRLRSTSNKNMAMTDILQQARKFRMSVTFCTINWMWIDPRVTGSLCDLLFECNDLYYNHGFRRKHNVKKGDRIAVDIEDQSGKISGRQFSHLLSTTLDGRMFKGTFDTENFVDPMEARKPLRREEKFMIDQDGNEVKVSEWENNIAYQIKALSKARPTGWTADELWNTLRLDEFRLRQAAGRVMRKMGIEKDVDRIGLATYDLSMVE